MDINGSILIVVKGTESIENIESYPHLAQYKDSQPTNGLVYLRTIYNSYEVTPVSPTEINMRALFLIDP